MDAIALHKAERDENTCRKDMTLSELVEHGRKLEQLEAQLAKKRQGQRNDLTSPSNDGEVHRREKAHRKGHETDAIVASALGISEPKYTRHPANTLRSTEGIHARC